MTAAEQAIIDKMRRGEPITPEDHIATIDDAEELAAFMEAIKANGRMTDGIRVAGLRRQKQIGGK